MDYLMADIYDESPKSPDDYREITEEEAFEKLGLKLALKDNVRCYFCIQKLNFFSFLF